MKPLISKPSALKQFYDLWSAAWSFTDVFETYKMSQVVNPSLLNHLNSSPVRAMAWHKYKSVFSVALPNNLIYFYDLKTENWADLALSHEFQQNIRCMEWKPNSGTILAVGCRYGVCIWTISTSVSTSLRQGRSVKVPESFVSSFQDAWCQYLSHPGHFPVTSLAWSPDGLQLATGSLLDDAILIWDIGLGYANPIRRAGNITCLSWSPNGFYLFAGSTQSCFRVWETKTWTCEKWNLGSTYCQTGCWSDNGGYLLVAMAGEPEFHSFQFARIPPQIGGVHLRTDNVRTSLSSHLAEAARTVGGGIWSMSWDPKGERLAITFKEEEEGSQYIALYQTSLLPTLSVSLRGYIKGPANSEYPSLISFKPNYPRGALLSTCWRNGKISFYPLYFSSQISSKMFSNWESAEF
eukprot:TRINITY_DN6594_c0_g1_i1.p1 TRINITY_DN6594_c0_g1~~TRINITY_DN6594_c0_g1_i1.p1  ORF type:complete len:408 (-),score=53.98 TRINITY_DN6594_c0_g1_i1:233-1456(-)